MTDSTYQRPGSGASKAPDDILRVRRAAEARRELLDVRRLLGIAEADDTRRDLTALLAELDGLLPLLRARAEAAVADTKRTGPAVAPSAAVDHRPAWVSYALPPGEWRYARWREAVAQELERIAADGEVPRDMERSVFQRARSFRTCGKHCLARHCLDCHQPRPGSAIQDDGSGRHDPALQRGSRPCNARSCGWCGRRKSREASSWIERALDVLPLVKGYRWQFLTLTTRYDPKRAEDVQWRALRDRARGILHAARRVWSKGDGKADFTLKQPGAAAILRVECGAEGGMVHAHVLYYGPYIDAGWLQGALARWYPAAGFVSVKPVGGDGRDGKEAAREAAKYTVKLPGVTDESWLAGKVTRRTINPVLAAAWEVATFRMHTTTKLGAFRSLEVPEGSEKDLEAADENEPCECCGSVGRWVWERWKTPEWLSRCHAAGVPGFRGGRLRSGREADGKRPRGS